MRNIKGQFVKGHKLLGGGLEAWRENGGEPWNKGKSTQTNSGRTHFRKGMIPHNYKGGQAGTQPYKNYYNRLRVCRQKNVEGSFTLAEWEALKMKFRYMCLCCKKCEPEITLSVDHIVPISKGGSNFIENIQPLCRSCNSRKSVKVINYKEQ